jgi:hypothetical protein
VHAAFSRGDASDKVVNPELPAVLQHLCGMEGAFVSSDALHH